MAKRSFLKSQTLIYSNNIPAKLLKHNLYPFYWRSSNLYIPKDILSLHMGRSLKPHSITLILALKTHSKHVLIHALMYIRLLCTEVAHRGPFAKEEKNFFMHLYSTQQKASR